MRLDVHLWFHNALEPSIAGVLSQLKQQGDAIMAALDDLKAAVAANDSVVDSAVLLIQGLSAQIAALKPNEADIAALAADVKARADALGAAVAAGTPAA